MFKIQMPKAEISPSPHPSPPRGEGKGEGLFGSLEIWDFEFVGSDPLIVDKYFFSHEFF